MPLKDKETCSLHTYGVVYHPITHFVETLEKSVKLF